jgi:hypothetical protein
MDHDTSLLTKLKEEACFRQQQHAAASRATNQAMTPRIQMIVGDWYTDEFGTSTHHQGGRLTEKWRPLSHPQRSKFPTRTESANGCRVRHVTVMREVVRSIKLPVVTFRLICR